jgi:hypothetical protein
MLMLKGLPLVQPPVGGVNQFVLARFDDDAEAVLTQFPLVLSQEFIGPWLGATPAAEAKPGASPP